MSVSEQDLEQAASGYRAIFEASVDGILIADLDGRIAEVSPSACRMYGFTREEMIGLDGTRLVHPESLNVAVEALARVRQGDSFHAAAAAVRKDGTVFYVQGPSTPFTFRGKPHIMAVVRDVTEQVAAEDRLREREEQYRRIFESSSDGLIILDPASDPIVEANPEVCRMHGYSYEELVGMRAKDLIHSDFHAEFADYMGTIVAGGTYQCEALNIRKDGTAFPVEVHGSTMVYRGRLHVLAVVRDVTERVRARELLEQRVAERTRELYTLLEVSRSVTSTLQLEPLLNVILDQLTLVAENDAIALLELRGDHLAVLLRRAPGLAERDFPRSYPTGSHGPIWEALRRGEVAIIGDVRGQDPMAAAYRGVVGDALDAALSFERSFMAVPLMLKDRIIGVLGLTSSRPNYYTEHHAHLALAIAGQAAIAIENARLYEQAQEAAVIEERQRLSRELHDSVSQALYTIVLGAKTARALLDREPADAAEPLDFVLTQAARGLAEMRALIFELRPEALEQEGLAAALAKQADALRARHLLRVETGTDDELELPLPAKEALYRIAQEALQNVVKHAGASEVRLMLTADGSQATLEVRDNGKGFDPTASFPGHLGLNTMRERVDRLGGTLELESAAGAGTTVRACVPMRDLSTGS